VRLLHNIEICQLHKDNTLCQCHFSGNVKSSSCSYVDIAELPLRYVTAAGQWHMQTQLMVQVF